MSSPPPSPVRTTPAPTRPTPSLTSLPTEALSQIASHLRSTSLLSLSRAHQSLFIQLSPDNTAFWHDIYRSRFLPRPYAPPPDFLTDWPFAVALRDLVDDLYLHTHLPYANLTPPTTHSPRLTFSSGLLCVAAGTSFQVYRRDRPNNAWHSVARLQVDAITALSASEAGVVVGFANHSVAVYHNHMRVFSRPMRGHRAPVTAVLQMHDIVISGSADKMIRLRSASTRRGHAVLRGHDGPVRWLAPAGDAAFVSHGGTDGRVKLWDIDRAVCLSTGRPGGPVLHAAVDEAGVVYAVCGRCVNVLDPRMGLGSTAAVLSLPRGRTWAGIGNIRALTLAGNGRLAAAVGGGGVAVWDPTGRWEARGLGWPRRWGTDVAWGLNAVMLGGKSVVVGGGAKELLTFSLDGRYEGLVMEDGVRRAAVSALIDVGEEGFVVARADGRVDFADVWAAEGAWSLAKQVMEDDTKGSRRFWHKAQHDEEDDMWSLGRAPKR